MNNFLINVEDVLIDIALQHKPPGSDPRALIHQWIHALASESQLFAHQKVKKTSLINLLKKNGLYENKESFGQKVSELAHIKPQDKPKFRFIDLFAGIGGIRIGFQSAGGHCVFSSEWDKYSQQTYFSNFGEYPFGDITKIDEKQIPDHDILCAGFPCQPFSKAGVSAREALAQPHGFSCQTQGSLFYEIIRIIRQKTPKIIFLENVANLMRHDNGQTFKIIKKSIKALGYSFNSAVINSQTVVPQRRIRCYIVCSKLDKDDFLFPAFEGPCIPLKECLEPNVDSTYTISQKLWDGHIKRTQRNLERGAGFTAFIANLDKPANTLVARYGKDGKECLVPNVGAIPRKLTERECARLQGFPDKFKIEVSRTQAYKQFGNSVVVPVIAKIAENISDQLIDKVVT